MVSGTLLHTNQEGIEDKSLYGNPKMTFFKSVFTKARNFVTEYKKLSKLNDNIQFGNTFKVEIPHAGDLLAGIYIDFELSDLLRKELFTKLNMEDDTTMKPQFTSYVNGIGFNIIKEIKLYIGGNLIQSLNSELIFMINELHSPYNQIQSFYHMTKYEDAFAVGISNINDMRCHMYIPFYFSKDPGLYLPLCSLTSSRVEVHVTLRTFEECIIRRYNLRSLSEPDLPGINGFETTSAGNIIPKGTVPGQYEKYIENIEGGIISFDVIMKTVYLDEADRKLFMICPKLEYLVELYNTGNQDIIENPVENTKYNIELVAKHPTKYLFWVLQRKDVYDDNYYQNYSYNYQAKYLNGIYTYYSGEHLIKDVQILVNNSSILDNINAIFLTNTQKYEAFKGSILHPIYVYNFSLSPEIHRPTGTFNMSLFNKKEFIIDLVNETKYTNQNTKQPLLFRYYTSYYNIITISDGFAGLLYH